MNVPALDLRAQYRSIKDEVMAAVQDVFESQQFILGRQVKELEEAVAAYCRCKYGVGVSSGTDALIIALMTEGIGPGDEVITTPYTFFATGGSIARTGATPVFVDIDPLTYNINPKLMEARITKRTKAIMPVHLYGQVADMDPIMAVARKHNLVVIEDGAQAIGAEYHGQRAGSIGEYGCFSFFPSKNLGGAGDGGMVVTNEPARAEKLGIMRVHGSKPKYYHHVIGGNFRLDTLQAAVLLVKLRHLDDWSAARQEKASDYRRLFRETGIAIAPQEINCLIGDCRNDKCDLKGRKGVVLPEEAPNVRHIYNQFVIRTDRRDELQKWLKERGVDTAIYYPVSLHMQGCFSLLGYKEGDMPASECAARQTLALPVYPELTEDMIAYVVAAIAGFHK
jgi:dTDP-4-amino-4,6-dideoxygalactose transaminase